MRIKTIVSQHRRDFQAVYECEHCGNSHESYGYDDDNFHTNVVPGMVCKMCHKKADNTSEARATKYPAGVQV